MSAEEKFLEYLRTHKRPVTAATLAKRFIISHSHASSILNALYENGLADIKVEGKKKFYKSKD
jgi:DNA-binding transcriptional ArsR family regulator